MRIFMAVRHSCDPKFYYGDLWSGNFYPALRQLGHEIVESKVDLLPASWFMSVPCKFTPQEQEVRARITQEIIDEVRQAHSRKPLDLFLSYFYNAHFDPAGFEAIHQLGIPTVNFYCNSIYQFELVADIAAKVSFAWHAEKEARSPLADELVAKGIKVYRQPRLPGDRWLVRKRFMLFWLETQLKPGDWVFCVCPPFPPLYLPLVRLAHRRRAKVAVSWFLAPEFWRPIPQIMGSYGQEFCQAVAETDVVISVSKCTAHQFREVYGYTEQVHIVPYHNVLFFQEPVSLPAGPPWKIGFMGRLEIQQKNLDTLLQALAKVVGVRQDVELHLYGGGSDRTQLEALALNLGIEKYVFFHGAYDHRSNLAEIVANCHFFVHPSRWEGGPCFSLLELMQAGRFCVAARVGGIPDLYEGHPEVGLLVDCNDQASIYQGLKTAWERVGKGSIDGEKSRARYFDGFDMTSAHRAWTSVIT